MRVAGREIATLENFMEALTEKTLDRVLESSNGICRCRRCLTDVIALTLNRLWPRYVTSESGRRFVQEEIEKDKVHVDVTRELYAALSVVKMHPSHSVNKSKASK